MSAVTVQSLMRRTAQYLVALAVLLVPACGDDGPSLACEAFDLDDANALVTNGDTGERKHSDDGADYGSVAACPCPGTSQESPKH